MARGEQSVSVSPRLDVDGGADDETVAIAFFNQINILFGTVTEFCIPEECPVMCAGVR